MAWDALVAAALACGLASCGTGSGTFGGSRATRTAGQSSTRQPPASVTPGPAPSGSWLTAQLLLAKTTVAAGGTLRAELVFRSSARRPRVLDRGCPGQFVALILSGHGETTSLLSGDQVCKPGVAFVVRPGTTIYHLVAQATVAQCVMFGHKPSGNVPQCLPGNISPALPPGSYEASVTASHTALLVDLGSLRPVRVQVTP